MCHTWINRLTYQMMTLIVCSIFDKKDAFDFEIANFRDLPGNIPTTYGYGPLISQRIRYSWACHNYRNFSSLHSERLFNQNFSARKLIRTVYKFMGRYPELA